MNISFDRTTLTDHEQAAVTMGFESDSTSKAAPPYQKQSLKWVATDANGHITAALTAEVLWDWMYIDELWVAEQTRGTGLGKRLMEAAEALAVSEGLEGVWLWTQSWQAEGFYQRLGYQAFTRFENFPKGYARIGLRKALAGA